MEEIQVGEYVRTEKQGIFIISHINPDIVDEYSRVCLCQNEKIAFTSIEEVKKLKHSKNIIDLIEVGDFVNGQEVYLENGKLAVDLVEYLPPYEFINDIEIETILTKEQYESNCYKIER